MHWVVNTQYCTVHGGKTQRREQDRNQEVSAAQHQERKEWGDCKHLLQGRGKRREFCFYWLFLNGKLRVSLQLWCAKSSKESPAGRPLPSWSPALPSSHQIVQYNRFIGLGAMLRSMTVLHVAVWNRDGRKGMPSKTSLSCGGNRACQHAEKWTLFETVHSLILTQKMSWCLNLIFSLFVFRSQRGTFYHPPDKLCSFFGPQFTLF